MTSSFTTVRRVIRSLVTLAPAPGRVRQAARWISAVAIGLLVSSLILGPEVGTLGMLGAMAAQTGRQEPMRRRVVLLATVGCATLLCETIGLLVGPYEWLLPIVLAGMTLAGMWTWHAFMVGPPGPINMLFAGAFGAYMGTQGFSLGELVGVTALNWIVGSIASIAILALDRQAPLREAVDAAEAAVALYRDRPADLTPGESNRMRSRAYLAIHDAWYVLHNGSGPHAGPRSDAGLDLIDRLKGTQLAMVELLHEESFPSYDLAIAENFRSLPLGRPPTGYLLRTAWASGSRPWLVAGRGAIAVFVAGLLMIVSPVGHPYWAVLSALIVLHMGASRADLAIRGIHRIVGTAVGVLVYFGILLLHPVAWVEVGIVILAIFIMETVVTRNYALAVVFVTVFALVMTPVSPDMSVGTVMRDRLVETIIGVGTAIAVIYLVGRRAPVLLVRRQYRLTLRAMINVLTDLAVGDLVSQLAREHRCELVLELQRSGAILSQQRPDDPEALARWLPVQEEATRFGFDVVAAAWRDLADGDPAAIVARRELTGVLDNLPPISSQDINAGRLAAHLRDIRYRFLGGTHDRAGNQAV